MTNPLVLDIHAGNTPFLPFESSQLETAGIRLLPSQLARVLNVSKQAVSQWVKQGRVILGSDGRVDPRQAIARLLATGDLSRMRLKILEPLRLEVAARDRRINDLEVMVAQRDQRIVELKREMVDVETEAEFQDAAAAGFSDLFVALQDQLTAFWKPLREAPPDVGLAAITSWLNAALADPESAGVVVDHFGAPALEEEEAGEVDRDG
jgi:hypothetical protein